MIQIEYYCILYCYYYHSRLPTKAVFVVGGVKPLTLCLGASRFHGFPSFPVPVDPSTAGSDDHPCLKIYRQYRHGVRNHGNLATILRTS